MLGRLMHYGIDALLIASVAAGIKRSTGLQPDLSQISDPTAKGIAEKYFGLGELVFDSSIAAARASRYFVRSYVGTTAAGVGPQA
ncbi:DUF1748-domain-containing protein [Tilletiaria anomala UBC 951]|uniref:DUF1748-domain-containing protein n=1 Tax=Tilletiaria anomala (strain ATCC 24038 / CBS 436.72 / UBC 951) TaxID=1037660 RepID=A0A066WNZ4_TILAU|nr:DUF1748-domain-containing protein [Tilletiaria anomala UBC 951]KDN52325.1 DUF1748-domain-containing protein [Tilletiaria anomala UBC 951]